MHDLGKILLLLSISAGLAVSVFGQNGQSLGDVARQARQQNQQKENQQKDSPDSQAAPSRRVFTDQDNPGQSSASDPSFGTPPAAGPQSSSNTESAQHGKLSAEQWKALILSAKSGIHALQNQIDTTNASIRFASPTCAVRCVERNERAIAKERQVERLRAQLEQQKKRLEGLQESARQQGYGNAVYDPN